MVNLSSSCNNKETTHNYSIRLGYRIVLPIAYLNVRLRYGMLDCNVIVMVRLKGGGGGLGAKPPSLEDVLLGLYILPYGPDKVKKRNLGVRLDCYFQVSKIIEFVKMFFHR